MGQEQSQNDHVNGVCHLCQNQFPSSRSLNRHIQSCHKCPYCSSTFNDYYDLQMHVFTKCSKRPPDDANQGPPHKPAKQGQPVVSGRVRPHSATGRPPPVVPPQASKEAINIIAGSVDISQKPVRRAKTMQARPRTARSPVNAQTFSPPKPASKTAPMVPPRPAPAVPPRPQAVVKPDEKGNAPPSPDYEPAETNDDADEKSVYVDEQSEEGPEHVSVVNSTAAPNQSSSSSSSKGSGKADSAKNNSAQSADHAQAGQKSILSRHGSKPSLPQLWVREFRSAVSQDTYGGSSKGTTVCLEAAVYLLHRRPITENCIDDIIRVGCVMHPRPGDIPFREAYLSLQRYHSQFDVLASERYSTHDLSSFFEALPQLVESSKKKSVAAMLRGASIGTVLLYFQDGDVFLFDPQEHVDESTKQPCGARVLEFEDMARIRSYFASQLPYVPIDDPRQNAVFNSFQLIVLGLKSNVKYVPLVSPSESKQPADLVDYQRRQPRGVQRTGTLNAKQVTSPPGGGGVYFLHQQAWLFVLVQVSGLRAFQQRQQQRQPPQALPGPRQAVSRQQQRKPQAQPKAGQGAPVKQPQPVSKGNKAAPAQPPRAAKGKAQQADQRRVVRDAAVAQKIASSSTVGGSNYPPGTQAPQQSPAPPLPKDFPQVPHLPYPAEETVDNLKAYVACVVATYEDVLAATRSQVLVERQRVKELTALIKGDKK